MVQSWQFVGYDFMRKADKENRLDEGLGILKEALKTAPSYHGVLYRGIRHDISTNIGDTISLNAISSFSISKAVASNFSVADPANGKYISPKSKVTIFSVDLHKSSRQLPSKAVGGTYEQEAIFLKNTKFRVKSIEPVTIKRPHAQWKAKIIHLEEI